MHALAALIGSTALLAQDPRDIRTGAVLPDQSYCDQPYVVRTRDGAWLCVMTTGSKHEGSNGQHVVSLRSTDQGCRAFKLRSGPPERHHHDHPCPGHARQPTAIRLANRAFCSDPLPQRAPRPHHEPQFAA